MIQAIIRGAIPTILFISFSVFAQVSLQNAFPDLSFQQPVDLQHAGDGSNRLFVVEQLGTIHVFENNSSVPSSSIFLDITDRVENGGEKGLLGLAFHPDYENNGYFYVNYTGRNPDSTVISRFQVSGADSNVANPNSELVLLAIAQPFENHNGGQIAFGPDGYLYIAVGDGGAGGDPFGHGQNLNTLLGSILRIDVDQQGGGLNYGIPPDNPFLGVPQARDEIYAYGVRNPWRMSFDLAGTGELWCGDVGQGDWEEVDIIEIGGNYGWNEMEGNHCYPPGSNCSNDTLGLNLKLPVWEYDHTQGRSITGGYVYRGSNVPYLSGKYIYADYTFGTIWALTYDGINPPVNETLLSASFLSSFGLDESNELYILFYGQGTVNRFVSDADVGMTLFIDPVNDPVPPQGGKFRFEMEINNLTPDPLDVDFFIEMTLPDQGTQTIISERTVNVAGNGTFARMPGIKIPATHPPGEYTVTGYYGEGLSMSTSVTFTKSAAQAVAAHSGAQAVHSLGTPAQPFLSQNYPNPFNPTTSVEFGMPSAEWVRLTVYDLLGREMARLLDEELAAGTYRVEWNGRIDSGTVAASGIYVYRLTAGAFAETRRMVLMK